MKNNKDIMKNNIVPQTSLKDMFNAAQISCDYFGLGQGKDNNGFTELKAIMLQGPRNIVNDVWKALHAKQPIKSSGVITKLGFKQLKDRAHQIPRHMTSIRSSYAKALKAMRHAVRNDKQAVAAPAVMAERPRAGVM